MTAIFNVLTLLAERASVVVVVGAGLHRHGADDGRSRRHRQCLHASTDRRRRATVLTPRRHWRHHSNLTSTARSVSILTLLDQYSCVYYERGGFLLICNETNKLQFLLTLSLFLFQKILTEQY